MPDARAYFDGIRFRGARPSSAGCGDQSPSARAFAPAEGERRTPRDRADRVASDIPDEVYTLW